MLLKGKTALIAGAGRNSGKAIALTFAREGADLIFVARTGDEIKQVAKECEQLGVKALALPADIGSHKDVNRVVQESVGRFGKVDTLVTVAGMRPHRLIWDYSYEEWEQVFAVNLHSLFYFAKALAPGMVERKSGTIVACGGTASITSVLPHTAVVMASKHGLYGLIKSLATDLGPYGVRANLIVVGGIKVDRRNPEWYPSGENPHTKSGEHEHRALRRGASPDELANVALFLSSDQSSYVTGDRIVCAGGVYM